MTAARDWDAASYDRISDPQYGWALEQLERLPLRGNEVVLDAGCGSGRVTALLAERVPRGRVYGVDSSPAMVQHAAEALGDRARILCQDLVQLSLPEPVDAVFSNATFHWIADHDALFRHLAAVLRPGGRLVAQCGGAGNVESVRSVARALDGGWEGPQHYATAEATRERLEAAGFVEVDCWLHQEPTSFAAGEECETFLRTVILGAHLQRMPPERHDAFVRTVADSLGPQPVVDYVRLNILATRGPW